MDVVNCPREWAPMGEPDVLQAGDRVAAVSELFVAHHRRLIGLAALLVDDRGGAEEVVQEAFLTLHRRWRLLRDPTACVAYLNTCVVNGSRRRLRQRRRLAVLVPRMAAPSDVLDSAEQQVVDREQLGRVRREIGELSRRQREVLVLRYYLDQSEAEIADTLGISCGSVKSHASRGLATLALRLKVEP
ncbi:RNA polymerase sigma-70 factor (sigma-E family) [Marmoricola sp. URHA0025 HA25]